MSNTYIRYPTNSGGGGSGSVTEVDTGAGLVGGPITASGTISVASISLTNQVVGSLPLSQTSGSLSLTGRVTGVLPIVNGGTGVSSSPGFAFTDLSNLGITAINAALLPGVDGFYDLGGLSGKNWNNVYAQFTFSSVAATIANLRIDQQVLSGIDYSVISINAIPALSIDNANENIVIGSTANSLAPLTVSANTDTLAAAQTGTIASFVGANGQTTRVGIESYSATAANGPGLNFRRAIGSASTASALTAGAAMGSIFWNGYVSTGFSAGRAIIAAAAAGTWSASAQGTTLQFQTTAAGTVTTNEKMRLDGNGSLSLGVSSATAQLHTTGSVRFAGIVGPGIALLDLTGNLTSGSVNVTTQIVGVVPAANSSGLNLLSGSVSLTNQVVGNLPVTNLNSGTSAGNTTFWRGDATWATPAISPTANIGSVSVTSSTGGAAYSMSLPGSQLAGVLSNNGAGGLSWVAASGATVQIFSSASGTYTTPVGCKSIKIIAVGGGGGGGGCDSAAAQSGAGGGGGGAATCIKWISTASLSATYTYYVADGGVGGAAGNNAGSVGTASLFGTIVMAGGGGLGGGSGTSATIAFLSNSSIGGVSTGGDLNISGAGGTSGMTLTGTGQNQAGNGGSSLFSPMSNPAINSNAAGSAGKLYGGGGGGGIQGNNGGTQVGGKGASGLIIVQEFYS